MKLINPTFEILEQAPGLEGIYEAIERAGRTCYKSKRPEGQTAKDFVDRMIASKHYAMLEHGTVYLALPFTNIDIMADCWEDSVDTFGIANKYGDNKYSVVTASFDKRDTEKNPFCVPMKESEVAYYYVTTNLRVLVENGWLDDLQYLCEPTECHEKRVTVRFTTDRGVSHEFVRHRVFSFAQESTRYCNYSKDKFGNELTFIIPSWYTGIDSSPSVISGEETFMKLLLQAESDYLGLLELGYTPQQARQVLPNALKTELVMTGFVSDWNHFFDLRARGTTGAPHPDAKALAEPLMQEFEKRNLL